jgi:osmotically-inducible protein OsmY
VEGITGRPGPTSLDVDGEAFALVSPLPARAERSPGLSASRRGTSGVVIALAQTGRRLWRQVHGARRNIDRWRLGAPLVAGAAVAGAVGEYFLDPHSGRRRRAVAKDRIAALLRRRKTDGERQTRYAPGVAKGAVEHATPSGRRPEELNDPALEAKVESEIFRDADAPKDKVSVSVEEGVVYLRGELATKKAAEGLARSARAVEGVEKVVNLIHRPGEEAPAKENRPGRGDAKRQSGQVRGKAKRQAPARSK